MSFGRQGVSGLGRGLACVEDGPSPCPSQAANVTAIAPVERPRLGDVGTSPKSGGQTGTGLAAGQGRGSAAGLPGEVSSLPPRLEAGAGGDGTVPPSCCPWVTWQVSGRARLVSRQFAPCGPSTPTHRPDWSPLRSSPHPLEKP